MEKKIFSGPIKRHPDFADKEPLVSLFPKDCLTLTDCMELSVKKYGKNPCMGWRDIEKIETQEVKKPDGKSQKWEIPVMGKLKWQSYNQVWKNIKNIGEGIAAWTGTGAGEAFGIYINTCKEWMQTAHGCFYKGIVLATCYATLGIDALIHVINETEMKGILCEEENLKHLENIKKDCKTLEYVITLKPTKHESKNYKIKSLDDVIKLGAEEVSKNGEKKISSKNDDVIVIMYTSGSTGMPKGVMVSNRNLIAAISAGIYALKVTPEDTYLGYLPLAHILELSAENLALFGGTKIGYGTPRTLTDKSCKPVGDISAVAPTVMAGVPRVYDTIKKGAMELFATGSGVKSKIFETAYNSRLTRIKDKVDSVFWQFLGDQLVFDKFKMGLGGKMRVLISGGAPLSKETQEFMRVCFGCSVVQGYGLTETCGGGTSQDINIKSFSTLNVGFPVPCAEVKLVDVEEMGYSSKNNPPTGEVLIRGAHITKGYFKNPEKTLEEYRDGWFYTVDIGRWNKDGTLSIIDRKKNLVKLAHGEYVAVNNLEMLYGDSQWVSPNGICVYGDSFKDNVVAIVCPNIPFLKRFANENGISDADDVAKLCNNDKIKKEVIKSFDEIAKAKKIDEVGICSKSSFN